MYLYKAQDLWMRESIYMCNIYEYNIIRVLTKVLYFPQEIKARGSQVQATIGYMVSSGLAWDTWDPVLRRKMPTLFLYSDKSLKAESCTYSAYCRDPRTEHRAARVKHVWIWVDWSLQQDWWIWVLKKSCVKQVRQKLNQEFDSGKCPADCTIWGKQRHSPLTTHWNNEQTDLKLNRQTRRSCCSPG